MHWKLVEFFIIMICKTIEKAYWIRRVLNENEVITMVKPDNRKKIFNRRKICSSRRQKPIVRSVKISFLLLHQIGFLLSGFFPPHPQKNKEGIRIFNYIYYYRNYYVIPYYYLLKSVFSPREKFYSQVFYREKPDTKNKFFEISNVSFYLFLLCSRWLLLSAFLSVISNVRFLQIWMLTLHNGTVRFLKINNMTLDVYKICELGGILIGTSR